MNVIKKALGVACALMIGFGIIFVPLSILGTINHYWILYNEPPGKLLAVTQLDDEMHYPAALLNIPLYITILLIGVYFGKRNQYCPLYKELNLIPK